jgi:hypothetical protein
LIADKRLPGVEMAEHRWRLPYRPLHPKKSTDRGKPSAIFYVKLPEVGDSPLRTAPCLPACKRHKRRPFAVKFERRIVRIDELEALALGELRKNPWCRGATRVFIAPRLEIHPIARAYWAPTRVLTGVSGVEACKREVWCVCERLGRHYELAIE